MASEDDKRATQPPPSRRERKSFLDEPVERLTDPDPDLEETRNEKRPRR